MKTHCCQTVSLQYCTAEKAYQQKIDVSIQKNYIRFSKRIKRKFLDIEVNRKFVTHGLACMGLHAFDNLFSKKEKIRSVRYSMQQS